MRVFRDAKEEYANNGIRMEWADAHGLSNSPFGRASPRPPVLRVIGEAKGGWLWIGVAELVTTAGVAAAAGSDEHGLLHHRHKLVVKPPRSVQKLRLAQRACCARQRSAQRFWGPLESLKVLRAGPMRATRLLSAV